MKKQDRIEKIAHSLLVLQLAKDAGEAKARAEAIVSKSGHEAEISSLLEDVKKEANALAERAKKADKRNLAEADALVKHAQSIERNIDATASRAKETKAKAKKAQKSLKREKKAEHFLEEADLAQIHGELQRLEKAAGDLQEILAMAERVQK